MLFNSDQFNRRMFNGGATIAETFSADRLVFRGFSLSDGSAMRLRRLTDSGPTREVAGGPVPRGDGRYQTSEFFRERVIEAEGIVTRSTAALLDAWLDTVRQNLSVPQGELDIADAAGTVKRYLVTVDNYEEMFSGREHYHITFCPFRIRFRCLTPFGGARGYTSVSLLGLYTSPTNQTVINTGTYRAQPIVTFIFTAASGLSALGLRNVTTGERIDLVSPTAAAGDVFILNGETRTVTKNGAAHDYTGAFPALDVSTNVLELTATATSFAADTTISYRPVYL